MRVPKLDTCEIKEINMTPEQRIDEALDSVLKASGSSLKNFTMQLTLDRMREAMRKIMIKSYISGSNDNFKSMKGKK